MSPNLSVVSTTPADSSVVTSSPTTLLVTFDRPVDSFTLGAADFRLVHVAVDGSTSPLLVDEAVITEALDSSDPSGRRVALSLSNGLAQGRYELQLDPNSLIRGLDGSSMASTSSTPVLADFTFKTTPTGLASATELGTIGPLESVVSGALNLANDPGAVQYYRFEVAPGHHWLVGLEISAHRDGGTLDSSISLFNSQGHALSTASIGLPSDPNDPYLFDGLDPGTYYVGIAASANIPDASGTYNPGQSEISPASSGGPFQLHLVADPADQPTRLLGLRLDHADPFSTDPTGLTLQFSGGLAVASLEDPSHPPLTLVDQAGKAWSITPIGYDAVRGQLSLAFNQDLPTGGYTLELAGLKSLVDLAGLAPIAQGLPAGTLGDFVVNPTIDPVGDLGTILPGLATSGLHSKVEVAAGGATTRSFVVLGGGIYAVEGVSSASGVHYSIEDHSGNVVTTGPSMFGDGETDVNLSPGVYSVVVTTDAPLSEVSLSIRQKENQLSSLLDSGVAQGPALSLRLVTPQADFGQTVGVSTVSSPQSPTGPVSTPSQAVSTNPGTGPVSTSPARAVNPGLPAIVGLPTPSGPPVAGLVYSGGPVGHPSSQSGQISAVGTSGPSGLASLASNGANLPPGLIAIPVSTDGGGPIDLDAAPLAPEAWLDGPASTKAGMTQEDGLLARSAGSRREDERTLAEVDWIGQLVAGALDWFGKPALEGKAGVGVVGLPSNGPESPTGPETPRSEEARLESASMTSPFGIGIVLGMISFAYHRKLKGRKQHAAKMRPKSACQPMLAGPHRRPGVRVR